jgi:ATP-dependent DNA helicase RecG
VEAIAAGGIDIVVGTHALIQESVEIPNLAVGIVDEQHRFGVMQRAALTDGGLRPHLMSMSATPIPRSLSLTVFGDLDVSVLDEMPPGRKPIKTRWVVPEQRDSAYDFVRSEIEGGRQAFIVFPLVEGSDAVQARAAIEEHERLSRDVFAEHRLGLLHGRMKTAEKEDVMERFSAGELDALVSTSVIEVGIDVPNATVMVIDGADRFGLAQLHQFRGRVGRGVAQSYCLLLSDAAGPDAAERLRIIETVSDGFELAEQDLRLRGPGDFLGTRQSGLPELRVASITDTGTASRAKREASAMLDADPELTAPEHSALSLALAKLLQASAPGVG